MVVEPSIKAVNGEKRLWVDDLATALQHRDWSKVIQLGIENIQPLANDVFTYLKSGKDSNKTMLVGQNTQASYLDLCILITCMCLAVTKQNTYQSIESVYGTLCQAYVGRADSFAQFSVKIDKAQLKPRLFSGITNLALLLGSSISNSKLTSHTVHYHILLIIQALGLKCRNARSVITGAAQPLSNIRLHNVNSRGNVIDIDMCAEYMFLCGKTLLLSREDPRRAFAFFYLSSICAQQPRVKQVSIHYCIVSGLRISILNKHLCKRLEKHSTKSILKKITNGDHVSLALILHALTIAMGFGDPYLYSYILYTHQQRLFSAGLYSLLQDSYNSVLLRLITRSLSEGKEHLSTSGHKQYVKVKSLHLLKSIQAHLSALQAGHHTSVTALSSKLEIPATSAQFLSLLATLHGANLNVSSSGDPLFYIKHRGSSQSDNPKANIFVSAALLNSVNSAIFPKQECIDILTAVDHSCIDKERLTLCHNCLDKIR